MKIYESNHGGDWIDLEYQGEEIWRLNIIYSCVYVRGLQGTIQEISEQIYKLLMDESSWRDNALMWERRAGDLAEECTRLKEELQLIRLNEQTI